jgi:hypothetical protein
MMVVGFITEGPQYPYLCGGRPSKKKKILSTIFHFEMQKEQPRRHASK